MSDGLDAIEQLAATLLRKVAAPQRRQILREIARDVRQSQSARIGRQQEPDGQAFAPRRPKQVDVAGAYAVKFLYPKGAAEPRRVFMKSWVRQGPLLTGFDVEAGGIRSFFWDQVAEWLPVDSADQNKRAGKFRRQGQVRRGAMFRKLRGGRHLKAGSTADEAWVGWIGPAATIAAVHQSGGTDRPSKRGKPVRYARRVLLGLTTGERGALVDGILARLIS
jgi:phage gpG-like protein